MVIYSYMYKTTMFVPKLPALSNYFKDFPPLFDEYINNFAKDGWELISVVNISTLVMACVWKKK